MEMIRVGIYVSDMEFGRALARSLAIETEKMEFILTDEEYIKAVSLFDLILTDSTETYSDILLSDEQQEEIYLQEQPYSVYKYLNSCKLADALYYVYFRKTGKILKGQKKRKLKLVAGVSDSGEAGLSETLIFSAETLSKIYEARCLFLSLTPYNGAVPDKGQGKKGCFMKFLYYLQCKEDFPVSLFINETDNVDFLAVEKLNPAYVEMDKELFHILLKKIEDTGEYDFLIVDIGNHISVRTLDVINISDAVIFAKSKLETSTIELIRKFTEVPLCTITQNADNMLPANEHRSDFIKNEMRSAERHMKVYHKDSEQIAIWTANNTGYENEKFV